MVRLEEAKAYLRIDSSFEDDLVASLLLTAEALCTDVGRLSAAEWDALSVYADGGEITIRGEEKSAEDVRQIVNLLRIGVLYALGYLYEHREEADHHDLVMTLRNLFFAIREGVV